MDFRALLNVGRHGVSVDGASPLQSASTEALRAELARTARALAEAQDQLAEAQDQLAEAQDELAKTRHLRLLGEISSGVAHDFNNALTTILGTTEWLLQNAALADDAREDLTHIRMATTDAAVYVRRLQEAAHRAPGLPGRGGELTPADDQADQGERVDLGAIAEHMPALTKGRWLELERRGVPITVVVDTEPVLPIRGSAPELRELLQNLIFNAIDAMQERGGRVTVRVRGTADEVTVSVCDDGEGIPYDVRPRIFEPFFTTKGGSGCGLGLSVCWGIAQKHRGSLEVESEVGLGTTVTLTLPVERSAAVAPPDFGIDAASAQSEPLRVLLIDDQLDVLESVHDMLKALGHEVQTAPDGERGLTLLEPGSFDLVITDLGMPGLDGLGVARGAKQRCPDIPVVLLTGWGALYASVPPKPVDVVLAKPPTLGGLSQALATARSKAAA